LTKDKQPVGRIMSRLVGDLTLVPKWTLSWVKDGEGEGQKGSRTFRPKNNLGLENQKELSELMFFGCMKTYFMNESSFLSRH
jgi:hypothetical protein